MKIQICTNQNHAGAVAFDKDKAERLIKPLSPKQVDGVIPDGLFPSLQVDFPCPEEGLFRFKEVG